MLSDLHFGPEPRDLAPTIHPIVPDLPHLTSAWVLPARQRLCRLTPTIALTVTWAGGRLRGTSGIPADTPVPHHPWDPQRGPRKTPGPSASAASAQSDFSERRALRRRLTGREAPIGRAQRLSRAHWLAWPSLGAPSPPPPLNPRGRGSPRPLLPSRAASVGTRAASRKVGGGPGAHGGR